MDQKYHQNVRKAGPPELSQLADELELMNQRLQDLRTQSAQQEVSHDGYETQASSQRRHHFPQSAAVLTGNPEVIAGEWRRIEIDMMRLCSHKFTASLAKQKAWKNKVGAPVSRDDDFIYEEWIPTDNRYFSVILMEKFQTLRDLARHEDWGPDLKFLRLYLDHTFRRASELSRSRRTLMAFFPDGSSEPTHVVFNTGLLTKNIERLYACFHVNARANELTSHAATFQPPRWFLYGFQTDSQLISPAKMKVYHGTSEFNSVMLPERVFYHNSPSDLVYDTSIPMESRVELSHLFGEPADAPSPHDRRGRLPAKYHRTGLGDLAAKFHYALGRLRTLLEDQPRLAVPQFFRDKHMGGKGEMQLVCPLGLDPETPSTVDCAMVIRRVANKAGDFYQPVTILSREMVFLHCRLVTAPDQPWLLQFMAPPVRSAHVEVEEPHRLQQHQAPPHENKMYRVPPQAQEIPDPESVYWSHRAGDPRDLRAPQPRYQPPPPPAAYPPTKLPPQTDYQYQPPIRHQPIPAPPAQQYPTQYQSAPPSAIPFHRPGQFGKQEMTTVADILIHNFPNQAEVELATLAPLLKQQIPYLANGKGLCKALVLAAADAGFVKSQIRGKQTYVSLPYYS